MTPKRPRNPLALAVLAQLAERPMHPYEIAAQMRLRGLHEVIRLNYGALYAVVESLAGASLIVTESQQRPGRRPERTVYAITPAGRTLMLDWIRELLRVPAREYPAFAAALALIAHLAPDEARLLLETRADALEERVHEAEAALDAARRHGVPQLFTIELDYVRAVVEAELEWVRRLATVIRDRSLDGLRQWAAFHAHPGLTAAEVLRIGAGPPDAEPAANGKSAKPRRTRASTSRGKRPGARRSR